ncbi:RNA recognition motif domain and Nucleotide-binding, alpha-beta plait domain-containing protein [Aphelenchoides besseyi]|nr:RNA recognition motif domain and Nucleotide-binding, alpha-beta plait domain-containing protein [Aphelenchoides besseyi]
MPRQPKRVRQMMSRSPSPAVRESRRSRSPEARKSHRRSRTYSQSRSRSRSPAQCKRLHIANIDDSVRRRDIEDCYGKFGKLSDIWVASYPPFYAFVVYEHSDDAAKALEKMRSGYVRDCKVKTSIALPRNQNGGGRRFNGGGRFGSGSGGRHDHRVLVLHVIVVRIVVLRLHLLAAVAVVAIPMTHVKICSLLF